MRKVKFNKWIPEQGYEYGFESEGWFHQWSNYPTGYVCGLIETADGLLHEIASNQIKFITPPESEPSVFLPFVRPVDSPSYKTWEPPPTNDSRRYKINGHLNPKVTLKTESYDRIKNIYPEPE